MARQHNKLTQVDYYSGTLANGTTTAALDITRHQHIGIVVKTAALTTGIELLVSSDGTNFAVAETLHLSSAGGGAYHCTRQLNHIPFRHIQIRNSGATAGATTIELAMLNEQH
jgi:hypothetical protein